jgi:hypothetical protein
MWPEGTSTISFSELGKPYKGRDSQGYSSSRRKFQLSSRLMAKLIASKRNTLIRIKDQFPDSEFYHKCYRRWPVWLLYFPFHWNGPIPHPLM